MKRLKYIVAKNYCLQNSQQKSLKCLTMRNISLLRWSWWIKALFQGSYAQQSPEILLLKFLNTSCLGGNFFAKFYETIVIICMKCFYLHWVHSKSQIFLMEYQWRLVFESRHLRSSSFICHLPGFWSWPNFLALPSISARFDTELQENSDFPGKASAKVFFIKIASSSGSASVKTLPLGSMSFTIQTFI